jgi:uncharacterized protein (DUF4213/DUF364 family)
LTETLDDLGKSLGNQMDAISLERVVLGLFFIGVKLSDGSGGICYTPLKNIAESVCCPKEARMMPYAGRFLGVTVKAVLEEMFNKNPFNKALGIAVIHALSSIIWANENPQGYQIIRNINLKDSFPVKEDANVVLVGTLISYFKLLKDKQKPFRLLETDTSNLKDDELPFYSPLEKAPEIVPLADTLVISGTTLLDDTLEGLLNMAKPGSEIILAGPTGSILPEALFRRGVKRIDGVMVTKPDELLDVLAQGGSGFHLFGKSVEKIAIEKN